MTGSSGRSSGAGAGAGAKDEEAMLLLEGLSNRHNNSKTLSISCYIIDAYNALLMIYDSFTPSFVFVPYESNSSMRSPIRAEYEISEMIIYLRLSVSIIVRLLANPTDCPWWDLQEGAMYFRPLEICEKARCTFDSEVHPIWPLQFVNNLDERLRTNSASPVWNRDPRDVIGRTVLQIRAAYSLEKIYLLRSFSSLQTSVDAPTTDEAAIHREERWYLR